MEPSESVLSDALHASNLVDGVEPMDYESDLAEALEQIPERGNGVDEASIIQHVDLLLAEFNRKLIISAHTCNENPDVDGLQDTMRRYYQECSASGDGPISNILFQIAARSFVFDKLPQSAKHTPQVLETRPNTTLHMRCLLANVLDEPAQVSFYQCPLENLESLQMYSPYHELLEVLGTEKISETQVKQLGLLYPTPKPFDEAGEVQVEKLQVCKMSQKSVKDERYALIAQVTFSLGKQCCSVLIPHGPVAVITQSSSDEHGFASLIWGIATDFKCVLGKPYEWPKIIEWLNFKETLMNLFVRFGGREALEREMQFLQKKFFPKGGSILSWSTYSKGLMIGRGKEQDFTTFQWVYHALCTIRDRLKFEWENGFIVGFVSSDDEERLLGDPHYPDRCLVRFSETHAKDVESQATAKYVKVLLSKPRSDRSVESSSVQITKKDFKETIKYMQKHFKYVVKANYTQANVSDMLPSAGAAPREEKRKRPRASKKTEYPVLGD